MLRFKRGWKLTLAVDLVARRGGRAGSEEGKHCLARPLSHVKLLLSHGESRGASSIEGQWVTPEAAKVSRESEVEFSKCLYLEIPIQGIQSEVSQKEKHQYRIWTHIYGIQKDGNNNPVYETAKETLMYRTVLWTLWERERVGRFGRMALKHVKYHVWNKLPVQVRCTILDAWGWCTGMTQRDGMGREEGGGFKMGNICIPVVDSFRYLAKPIQYVKFKNKKKLKK